MNDVAGQPLLPADPDVDLGVPAQRVELRQHPLAVLGAISVGGVIGALARYGITTAVPGPFPWATLGINVLGCALIGVLMVLVGGVWRARPLARPFLGVGVLGGFTTFSTYTVDTLTLVRHGSLGAAIGYAVATLVGAVAATWLGLSITDSLMRRRGVS